MPLRTLQDGQESVVQDEGEKEIVEDGEQAATEDKEKDKEKEEEKKDELPEDLRTLTVYPEPMMTNEQVRHGGFMLYVFGKLHRQTAGQTANSFEYLNLSDVVIGNRRNHVRLPGHISGDLGLH